jgi:hypothetical protein
LTQTEIGVCDTAADQTLTNDVEGTNVDESPVGDPAVTVTNELPDVVTNGNLIKTFVFGMPVIGSTGLTFCGPGGVLLTVMVEAVIAAALRVLLLVLGSTSTVVGDVVVVEVTVGELEMVPGLDGVIENVKDEVPPLRTEPASVHVTVALSLLAFKTVTALATQPAGTVMDGTELFGEIVTWLTT